MRAVRSLTVRGRTVGWRLKVSWLMGGGWRRVRSGKWVVAEDWWGAMLNLGSGQNRRCLGRQHGHSPRTSVNTSY